jgi:hypothetical protein
MNPYEAMADDLAKQIKDIKKETNAKRIEWQGLREIVGDAEHDRILGNPSPATEDTIQSDRWA